MCLFNYYYYRIKYVCDKLSYVWNSKMEWFESIIVLHTHTHTHDDEEIIGRFSYKYGKILFNLIEIIIIYIVIINLFYLFMRWK